MDYTRNEDKLCSQDPVRSRLIDLKVTEGDDITEPIVLADVKAHLRITFNDDDSYLGILIKSCRAALEKYTALSFVTKSIQMIAEQNIPFELPYGPIKEISNVKDKAGGAIIDYTTNGLDFKSISVLGYVDISYTAGYDKLPADLKLALLEEIAWRYENRGDGNGKSGISDIAKSYAKPHRRVPVVL